MKFTYPAVFHKTEQGTYEGYFPDLACCYAKGDTLDEALEDAIHSAYDWISLELTEEEPDFPPVSDVADLGKSEGELQEICRQHPAFLRDGTNKFKKGERKPYCCDIRNAAIRFSFYLFQVFSISFFSLLIRSDSLIF